MDIFDLSYYDYYLPPELIAQEPANPRDSSKLLVLDRKSGGLEDHSFSDIPYLLNGDDIIVFNNTKVIPARIFGKKASGGNVEILLLEQLDGNRWEALVNPSQRVKAGTIISVSVNFSVEIRGKYNEGTREVILHCEEDMLEALYKYGHVPLPHYIDRSDRAEDFQRYQTIYAKHEGAVAAPTAGLHFTEDIFRKLELRGIQRIELTLHVGWGTFRPVKCSDIREHEMHSEIYIISEETATELNKALKSKRRIIAVGTTTVRALESCALTGFPIEPRTSRTEIFIFPGFDFKLTGAMITNFHLPKSTLLMMVSAFASPERIFSAYQHAIEKKYRFYSYGDAMLIF